MRARLGLIVGIAAAVGCGSTARRAAAPTSTATPNRAGAGAADIPTTAGDRAISAAAADRATAPAPTTPPPDDRPVVVTTAELELCSEAGKQVQGFDLSGDGRPDLWKLHQPAADGGTARRTCQKTDVDFDGRDDLRTGYDEVGRPLFELFDLDFDGRFEVQKRYNPDFGMVAEVAHDSNFDGDFDLFESYDDAGRLLLRARDRNYDSALDWWEIYETGKLVERQVDDDFDGIADRAE